MKYFSNEKRKLQIINPIEIINLCASPSGRSAQRWVNEDEKIVHAPNKPVRARRVYPRAPRVSLRSHTLAALNHIALASEPAIS
jgi:hypothetical protein